MPRASEPKPHKPKSPEKQAVPAHDQPGRHWGGYYRYVLVGGAVVALVAVGVVVSSASRAGTAANAKKQLLASGHHSGLAGAAASTSPSAPPSSTTSTSTTTTVPPVPEVLSVTPKAGTSGVAPTTPIRVTLASPPLAGSPMPVLSPSVAGAWSVTGDTLSFTPARPWAPWSTETVTVPATLATPEQVSFTVEGVSLLRFQQLLAELDYLPVRFGLTATASSLPSEPTVASDVSTSPQPGVFTWRFPNIPSTLADSWAPGQVNVVTQGAVMQFEYQYGLTIDGLAGPEVWGALTKAVAARQLDPYPYDYLMVSETVPESLTVWREGEYIYSTPVNTGVPGAQTPIGTWPVYEHVQYSTMSGTDVDGYHYVVPNVPWDAYFYDGDAVHGYPRASYGFPQSNGCVELPISNAEVVWPMDPIGTLVNVSP